VFAPGTGLLHHFAQVDLAVVGQVQRNMAAAQEQGMTNQLSRKGGIAPAPFPGGKCTSAGAQFATKGITGFQGNVGYAVGAAK
jgi:hypothetical protein